MKCAVVILMVVTLMIPMYAVAEGFDASEYTRDDLLEIRNIITSAITADRLGETIYSENGISIAWIGLVVEDRYVKADFLISNTSGIDLSVDLVTIAFNGIKLPITNAGSKSLESGLCLPTGAYNHWLISKEDMDNYLIDTIETVTVTVDILDESISKYKPIQSAKLSVSIK